MDESDKIVLNIIETLYPEWIERQKKLYLTMDEYDMYKQIIFDVFGCDIERATMEQERGTNFTDLERKLQIMKLSKKLKEEEKKKKGKKK